MPVEDELHGTLARAHKLSRDDFSRDLSAETRKRLEDLIGPKLVAFLARGTSGTALRRVIGGLDQYLSRVQSSRMKIRQQRIQALDESVVQIERIVQGALKVAQMAFAPDEHRNVTLRMQLEEQMVVNAVRGYAHLKVQSQKKTILLKAEEARLDKVVEETKVATKLQLFGLHLENETNGQVIVKRLGQKSEQFMRCHRAAAENVAPNFFDDFKPAVAGLKVLNVFKVKQHLLLQQFKEKSLSLDRHAKVKGLFCEVPAESVEALLALGMGCANDRASLQCADVFKCSWFGSMNKNHHPEEGDGGDGKGEQKPSYAEDRVRKSKRVSLPIRFSRYSTLQQTAGQRKANMANASRLRYLVLCRVIMERLFVTSKAYKGFPTLSEPAAFDSMYNPSQEEYLIFQPQNILPEFVVQCRWDVQDSVSESSNIPAMAAAQSDKSTSSDSRTPFEILGRMRVPGAAQSKGEEARHRQAGDGEAAEGSGFGALHEIQNTFEGFLQSQTNRWAGRRAKLGKPESIVQLGRLRTRRDSLQQQLRSCRQQTHRLSSRAGTGPNSSAQKNRRANRYSRR